MKHALGIKRLTGALVTSCLAIGSVALSAGPAAAAAPSNDQFVNAATLTLDTTGRANVSGSTSQATLEAGEPTHTPDASPVNGSVWYTLTPTTSGNLGIAAGGLGDVDTVLALYTGSTLNALARVASDDDPNVLSQQAFIDGVPVTAGTTYRIAVATKGGSQGAFVLSARLAPHPDNDDLDAADTWYLGSHVTTWNVNATVETGEPQHVTGTTPARTLWWQLDAEHNGTLALSTVGSNIDTVLAVYRLDAAGTSFANVTRIASNDDAGPGTFASALSGLQLKANHRYFIVVGGYDATKQGRIELSDTWVQSTHPDNDDFADAYDINDVYDFDGSTVTATSEVGEPEHSPSYMTDRSLWYRFTPSADGAVTVDLTGSTFDTALALYSGTSMADLVPVAYDRGKDVSRPTRITRVPVLAGQHYFLAVAGIGEASGIVDGTFRLRRRPTVSSLSATGGPLAGGNWVQIHGTNLAGSTTEVTLGSTPVKTVQVDPEDPEHAIAFLVPGGLPAGPLAVKVTTDGGSAAYEPTYVVGQPTLGTLSRTHARLAGGETVVMTGTDFSGVPVVKVGGIQAVGVTVLSPTSLSFVTPARTTPGTVPVVVQTAGGTTAPGSLTYLPRPVVTKLSRSAGPHRGGYAVKVSGRGLVAVSKVLVGSKAAAFSLVGGKLVVTVPKGRPGRTVVVRVVTPGGTSAAVKVARFRYR